MPGRLGAIRRHVLARHPFRGVALERDCHLVNVELDVSHEHQELHRLDGESALVVVVFEIRPRDVEERVDSVPDLSQAPLSSCGDRTIAMAIATR